MISKTLQSNATRIDRSLSEPIAAFVATNRCANSTRHREHVFTAFYNRTFIAVLSVSTINVSINLPKRLLWFSRTPPLRCYDFLTFYKTLTGKLLDNCMLGLRNCFLRANVRGKSRLLRTLRASGRQMNSPLTCEPTQRWDETIKPTICFPY